MKARGVFRMLGSAALLVVATTALCGVLYPAAVTGVAQAAFPWQANGSIIEVDGVRYGSALVGQPASDEGHLWGRVSGAEGRTFRGEDGEPVLWYAPACESPASDAFAERVAERVAEVRAAHPDQGDRPVPSDLVTTSGSGFDPHISPAAAEYQVGRVAAATGRTPDEVRAIIDACTEQPLLGAVGEARVNVLRVNLMLDGVL